MKITIITSTLNCRNDIVLTSKSIGSQTYSNIEWIVIDGGSTDGTIDLLSNDDKVTYWVSEKDGGIYSALNKGIGQSNGDWIIFMGAGDIFYSNKTGS
jgi:glycosyltransferase involved in cell wall biosynthesis